MGDQIAVMREGRVEQIGTPEELYFSPSSAFVAGLFGEVNQIPGRVVGGHVETAVGRICAPGMAEGSLVDVLVRPEALRVQPLAGAGSKAIVMTARLLGRSSLIHLSVDTDAGEGLHLHSRVPGRMLPGEGTEVRITLDEQNVFVFPVAD